MCGIFALLCKTDVDAQSICDGSILHYNFMKGSKRGPEYSKLEMINSKIVFGFHRLAINGLTPDSNQPIVKNNNVLICNGEIYNHEELHQSFGILPTTQSDCESILTAYNALGTKVCDLLDGVFGFILYDKENDCVIVARDPYGVRPLYECVYENGNICFASDLAPLLYDEKILRIKQFEPGTYSVYKYVNTLSRFIVQKQERYFHAESILPYDNISPLSEMYYMSEFVKHLRNSIQKRVNNCERQIACLLSGGLDSSIITAYVNKFYKEKTGKSVETYSIGLENASDFKFAQMVSHHVGTIHTEIIKTNEDFLDSIPNVIRDIESYDTTTVRASVGNWNVGHYIKYNSDAKVIFNGDGADELMGGYLYFYYAPDEEGFQYECLNLLKKISHFDVLRSDKSISSHGLEPRTPFLDKELTKYYLSIPRKYTNHNTKGRCEKYFIRKAIQLFEPDLLPEDVLWRTKEAFSDGVSSHDKSWYQIIQNHIEDKKTTIIQETDESSYPCHMKPKTVEQVYYYQLFSNNFINENSECVKLILPKYWMPKFVEGATDASARTLKVYEKKVLKK